MTIKYDCMIFGYLNTLNIFDNFFLENRKSNLSSRSDVRIMRFCSLETSFKTSIIIKSLFKSFYTIFIPLQLYLRHTLLTWKLNYNPTFYLFQIFFVKSRLNLDTCSQYLFKKYFFRNPLRDWLKIKTLSHTIMDLLLHNHHVRFRNTTFDRFLRNSIKFPNSTFR